MYTNTKTLLTFNNAPGAIDCIDGIRSITILWVIIGHLSINYLNKYTANIIEFADVSNFNIFLLWFSNNLPHKINFNYLQWAELRRNIWLTSAELSVDTFFALSGLLLVYTSTKKMKQSRYLGKKT